MVHRDRSPAGRVSVDDVVRTVSDNLRVRSAPGVGVSSAKLGPLLRTDTKLFVIEGPVAADGYDWYHVLPFDGGLPGGWVARADHDGTPWLARDTQACPTLPLDATAFRSMKPYGGLACYGSNEIEVIGDIRCELATVDRPITGPDWIRTNRQCRFEVGGETIEFFDGGIQGLGLPTTGAARVTGHFDDPQAAAVRLWRRVTEGGFRVGCGQLPRDVRGDRPDGGPLRLTRKRAAKGRD